MERWLKKLFIGMLSLIALFSMSACTLPAHHYPDYKEITAIQLIHYDETGAEPPKFWFVFTIEPYINFDENKCTVLEELPAEKIKEFDADMRKVGTMRGGSAAYTKAPYGYGVRFLYDDGDFFVVTWSKFNEETVYPGFAGMYEPNGEPGYCQDANPLWYMIAATNYFEMKIPY